MQDAEHSQQIEASRRLHKDLGELLDPQTETHKERPMSAEYEGTLEAIFHKLGDFFESMTKLDLSEFYTVLEELITDLLIQDDSDRARSLRVFFYRNFAEPMDARIKLPGFADNVLNLDGRILQSVSDIAADYLSEKVGEWRG